VLDSLRGTGKGGSGGGPPVWSRSPTLGKSSVSGWCSHRPCPRLAGGIASSRLVTTRAGSPSLGSFHGPSASGSEPSLRGRGDLAPDATMVRGECCGPVIDGQLECNVRVSATLFIGWVALICRKLCVRRRERHDCIIRTRGEGAALRPVVQRCPDGSGAAGRRACSCGVGLDAGSLCALGGNPGSACGAGNRVLRAADARSLMPSWLPRQPPPRLF
jgi:hypothetical protein